VVRVRLPSQPRHAELLAYRPLELAHVGGRPLATQRVSLVTELAGAEAGGKLPVGRRLRMLALFSLPDGAGALNLRRERYQLVRLVEEIAAENQKAVELRVLQYGATRAQLENALLEVDGWDVLHISGHGLPAGLLLETSEGRPDLVSSSELVDLLAPANASIKLVTLSSCDSAAATAAQQLRLLGINPEPSEQDSDQDPGAGEAQDGDGVLPAVAAALVRQVGCAVLAMRYPVVDDFAVALAHQVYDLLMGKQQPLPRALQEALPRTVGETPTPGAPPLSVATPALFGAPATDLRLVAPAGAPVVFDETTVKLAAFPPQPERFVGRVGPMTRANAALAPRSGASGVLLHGMAGAGKTACALELAYNHERSFSRLVWHKARDEGSDIAGALTALALDLEAQLPGLKLVHLVDDEQALRSLCPS
jgi:hypothetical protein